MNKTYRKGAIGALMDEYERAVSELDLLIRRLPDDGFVKVVDTQTTDDECRSAQTIMSHVIRAGYGYADYIREQFSSSSTRPEPVLLTRQESLEQLKEIMAYTAETLEDKWELKEDEITAIVIKSRWGVTYDMEQLLEHAIVHILRHRRQIEKFIAQGLIVCN